MPLSTWSEKFNALPLEAREIAAKCEWQMRVNQLRMERARVQKYYKQHIAAIDSHIKNIERELGKDA